ncbi:MAG: SHOCT domain-containing protein [Candidatus Levyibacteriota bacterium]
MFGCLFGLLFLAGSIFAGRKFWKFIGNGFTLSNRTRHFSELANDTATNNLIFRIDENLENPWLKRIAASPMYGQVPENIVELMNRVTPDPNEKVISSIWTSHGLSHQGYLLITTSYLRWIQVIPSGKDDSFWGLNTIIDKRNDRFGDNQVGVGTILDIQGLQFQVKQNKSGAQEFTKLYGLVQQALLHPSGKTENTTKPVDAGNSTPTTHVPNIAEEIKQLATLREQNIITEEEFKAGKERLLKNS